MTKRYRAIWMVVLGGLLVSGGAGPADAQVRGPTIIDPRFAATPVITDRFVLNLGGFLAEYTSSAGAGVGGAGIGSIINLEEVLGLSSDDDLIRIDGMYRFTNKSALVFGYYGFSRDAAGVFQAEVDYLDLRFVGVYSATNDVRVYTVGYRRSLINTGRIDAGLNLGISTFDFEMGIGGEAVLIGGIPGQLPEAEQRVAVRDVIAPVPTVGMFIDYALKPRLILRLSAAFLDVDLDDYDGRFIDTRATFDWFFSRHWGIGAGLGNTDVRVENTGNDPYRFDYRYDGLLLYLSASY